MDVKRMETLAASYARKSEAAYMRYQQTGGAHQFWEYRHYDEIAEAINIALAAAEDHQKMVNYRLYIGEWATKAKRIKENGDDAGALLSSIIAVGGMLY